MKIQRVTLLKYLNCGEPILHEELDYFSNIKQSKEKWIDVDLDAIGQKLLKFIIDHEAQMPAKEKSVWTEKWQAMQEDRQPEAFFKQKINGLKSIIDIYEAHLQKRNYHFDLHIYKQTIPVYVDMKLKNADKYNPRRIEVTYFLKIHKEYILQEFTLHTMTLDVLKTVVEPFTFEKLFQVFNLHPQFSDIDEYTAALERTKRTQSKSGTQYKAKGIGFQKYDRLAASLDGDKVIVEEKLEVEEKIHHRFEFKRSVQLPYVRVFSLSKKRYFFVHVDDLELYQYEKNAANKLILQDKNKAIISKIFASKKKAYGDLASKKGLGIIVMAAGESGTGKTSTAEVYAELNKKPLYTMQVDEVGVNASSVEKNLYTILERIQKWQAVLLIDEADIFLSKRNQDLERSAIVGIFLRLLEYFEGVIFLTTNRLEVIDPAALSRVTLVLRYPNITPEVSKVIWQQNLRSAGIKIDSLERLPALNLSGRDIRNYVKLIHYIFDDHVTEEQVLDIIQEDQR